MPFFGWLRRPVTTSLGWSMPPQRQLHPTSFPFGAQDTKSASFSDTKGTMARKERTAQRSLRCNCSTKCFSSWCFFCWEKLSIGEFVKKKTTRKFFHAKRFFVANGEFQPTQPEYENTMCLILLLVVCRKSLRGSFLRWLLPVVVLNGCPPIDDKAA